MIVTKKEEQNQEHLILTKKKKSRIKNKIIFVASAISRMDTTKNAIGEHVNVNGARTPRTP